MNPDSHPLTRRQALLGTLAGGVSVAFLSSTFSLAAATPAPSPAAEPEFVPENDYPFFGYDPEAATATRDR